MGFIRRLSVLVAIIFFAQPTWAAYSPKVGVQSEKDGTAYLTVGGRKAAHVMTPNAGLDPTQRATIAAERLTKLLGAGFDPNKLSVKIVGRNARVVAGETLVMVVTPAEAKAHGTTGADLAQSWVKNLRKLLSLPPLTITPASLTIPFGETRSAQVECSLNSPVQFEIANPSLVALDLKKKPGFVVVTGTGVGDGAVTFRCEDYTATLSLTVRKYAGSVLQGAKRAIVTGTAVPTNMVADAARDAACQAVSLEPGAHIEAVDLPPVTQSPSPGQKILVKAMVETEGAGYLPRKIIVPVEVENSRIPKTTAQWMMYSNNPEQLRKYQTLFVGRLDGSARDARLLYHHQNMMDRRVGFVIDVVNPTRSSAQLHVIEGIAEPIRDTVIVGYVAGLEFVQNQRSFTGRVYEIPPESRQVLVSQCLAYDRTASGIMELRLLTGDQALVRVTAEPEDQRVVEDSYPVPVPALGVDPQRIALSDHVYPGPVQEYNVTYTAGKAWVFLRLGKDALKHATEDMQLYGNYGVTYDIKANIENPLSDPVTAEIAFEATAGPASGIFYVGGDLVKVRYLTPPSETSLGRVTVAPGQTKSFTISTIPLSGSAYPATLIIRPVGSLKTVGGR